MLVEVTRELASVAESDAGELELVVGRMLLRVPGACMIPSTVRIFVCTELEAGRCSCSPTGA